MFLTRGIGGFVFRLFLFYGLLLVPWPGLDVGYAWVFRASGNVVLSSFGSYGDVRFDLPSEPSPKYDTELQLINRRNGWGCQMWHSSRYAGYLPTAAIIALVLATPVPWSRRWRGLLLGLVLVNVFIAVRVAISIVCVFRDVDLFVYSSFWNRVVDLAYEAISESTVTTILAPVLIWILVIFRPSDWEPLLGKTDHHPQQKPS